MVIQCDIENQDCVLVFSSRDDVTTPYLHLVILFLSDTACSFFIGRRQSCRLRGSAGWAVNLAPASAEKSQWLTRQPIRAFPNVEGSDSLRSSSGTNYTTSK